MYMNDFHKFSKLNSKTAEPSEIKGVYGGSTKRPSAGGWLRCSNTTDVELSGERR